MCDESRYSGFEGRTDAEAEMPFCRPSQPERMVLLDDWQNGHPDSWDYEKILRDNDVSVVWDGGALPDEWDGWSLSWSHGCMFLGNYPERMARRAAALFIWLWTHGVSASFADKIMGGFLMWLELQENRTLSFTLNTKEESWIPTREAISDILAKLGPIAEDSEIIVTITNRKKSNGKA